MSRRHHWGRTRVSADDIERALSGPTRLRGITVPCTKYLETRRFYVDRLGMRLTGQNRGHAVIEASGIRLVLIDASRVQGFVRKDGQGLYLELQVGNLEAVRARLAEDGKPLYQPRTSPSGYLLTVVDPEGNLVNLVEPRTREPR